MTSTTFSSRRSFHTARRRARFVAILDALRQRPNHMLALSDVLLRFKVRGQRSLGYQVVPVDLIIGSEGRARDFDRNFLPRAAYLQHRWSSIAQAMAQGVHLPPIDLIKIGNCYFVRDGNHRVSVAHQRGQVDIDAYVTEIIVDGLLPPDLSACDLRLLEEERTAVTMCDRQYLVRLSALALSIEKQAIHMYAYLGA